MDGGNVVFYKINIIKILYGGYLIRIIGVIGVVGVINVTGVIGVIMIGSLIGVIGVIAVIAVIGIEKLNFNKRIKGILKIKDRNKT